MTAGGVIVVLGDSLSSAYGIDVASGWVRLLQDRLEVALTMANSCPWILRHAGAGPSHIAINAL